MKKMHLEKLFVCFICLVFVCLFNFLSFQASAYLDVHMRLRGMIWYGEASWYGRKFHGRKTSNGEKFDKNELTAAHKFLPFNTNVLVTNLKNNKSVIVRINDRGPFKGNRIIDLSEEAASMIDSKREGIAYVKVQVLPSIK